MQIQVWNKEMELLSRDEAEPPPFLNPPVKIRLEFGYGVEAHQLNELDRAIREKILQSYQIQCVLEFLPPNPWAG